MKQMQEAMSRPEMQQQMAEMQAYMQNQQVQQRMQVRIPNSTKAMCTCTSCMPRKTLWLMLWVERVSNQSCRRHSVG
jgi:hypothetical protein